MTEPRNADRATDASRALTAFLTDTSPPDQNMAEAMVALITGLRHYADRHGIDFGQVLTSSDSTYAGQRAAEHAYHMGQEVRIRARTLLGPHMDGLPAIGVIAAVPRDREGAQAYAVRFPDGAEAVPFTVDEIESAPRFRPVLTGQGIVTSLADAEHRLIETSARIHLHRLQGLAAPAADISDRGRLSVAIGAMYGVSGQDILREFTPQVMGRVGDVQTIAAADKLGSEHGKAGTEPFGDLDLDGDAEARLMSWLGEIGPTTAANHPRRVAMLSAYRDAYDRERTREQGNRSTRTGLTTSSPAYLAGRDFPQHPGESLTAGASGPAASSAPPVTRRGARPQRLPRGRLPGPAHRRIEGVRQPCWRRDYQRSRSRPASGPPDHPGAGGQCRTRHAYQRGPCLHAGRLASDRATYRGRPQFHARLSAIRQHMTGRFLSFMIAVRRLVRVPNWFAFEPEWSGSTK